MARSSLVQRTVYCNARWIGCRVAQRERNLRLVHPGRHLDHNGNKHCAVAGVIVSAGLPIEVKAIGKVGNRVLIDVPAIHCDELAWFARVILYLILRIAVIGKTEAVVVVAINIEINADSYE